MFDTGIVNSVWEFLKIHACLIGLMENFLCPQKITGSRYVSLFQSFVENYYSHQPPEYTRLDHNRIENGILDSATNSPSGTCRLCFHTFCIGSYSKFFYFSHFLDFLPSMSVLVIHYYTKYHFCSWMVRRSRGSHKNFNGALGLFYEEVIGSLKLFVLIVNYYHGGFCFEEKWKMKINWWKDYHDCVDPYITTRVYTHEYKYSKFLCWSNVSNFEFVWCLKRYNICCL